MLHQGLIYPTKDYRLTWPPKLGECCCFKKKTIFLKFVNDFYNKNLFLLSYRYLYKLAITVFLHEIFMPRI